jgi:thymidylate synthase
MYPSEEDYKKEKETDEKRMYINHYIDYAMRWGMTFDEIDQLYQLVKNIKDKK